VPLSELALEDFRSEHEAFGADVQAVFDWQASTDARDTQGGTSRRSVERQLEEAAARLAGRQDVIV
jgi:argininosuccinate lyase